MLRLCKGAIYLNPCLSGCWDPWSLLTQSLPVTLHTQEPLKEMTKGEVDDNKLHQNIVMPEQVKVSLKQWWATLRQGDTVTVRYPHGRHGLSGKKSNRQDLQLIELNITIILR